MKKIFYCLMASTIAILLLLPELATPAFAASSQPTPPAPKATPAPKAKPAKIAKKAQLARQAGGKQRKPANKRFYSRTPQEDNQFFCGTSHSDNFGSFVGRNQGNSGNQGLNEGFHQDNSVNGGNSLINQRGSSRRHNQFYCGTSRSRITALYEGYNQGNSGNQGANRGRLQDNSSNAGNQIIN